MLEKHDPSSRGPFYPVSHPDSPAEEDDAAAAAADELAASAAVEHQIVRTLFNLGRQVTAVLDLDDLLTKIPILTGRLISFEAFAVYLLDERRGELNSAYLVGYPPSDETRRLKLGRGPLGAAVESVAFADGAEIEGDGGR